MPRGCPKAPLEERFLKKCIRSGDCMIWTGGEYPNGYGEVLKKTYGTHYAHQWACHHWNGSPLPVEEGMCVKHSCDEHLCVNPAHLSYGTVQENIQEMVERHPKAMGRVPPTDAELTLLRQMIVDDVPRREMMRRIGHSRAWIDRIVRDYI